MTDVREGATVGNVRRAAAALLPVLLAATAAPAADPLASPWREIAPGVLAASGGDVGADARWGARVVLVDAAQARLSVQFDARTPRLEEWRARFPNALLIANGSFYLSSRPCARPAISSPRGSWCTARGAG